jgi:transposase
MNEVSIIGLDLAKNVFQVHGAAANGEVVFRKKLSRDKLLTFFAAQRPTIVAMEACGGSHFWAREIAALGHQAKIGAACLCQAVCQKAEE